MWENESRDNQRNPISMLELFEDKIHNAWNYYNDLKSRSENLKKKIDNYRENMAIIKSG